MNKELSSSAPDGLLGRDEPPPFEMLETQQAALLLLVCDHGGRAFPRRLRHLGLSERELGRHIVWDIGAAGLTRRLSADLGAPAVIGTYSRLVIDLNRPLDDLTLIREISDGAVVPGNRNLDAQAIRARVESIYQPYHHAVAAAVERAERIAGRAVAVVSIHSFTPSLHHGALRPWHVGVLSNRDRRLADPLIAHLSRADGVVVGDNQPYSGLDQFGQTIEVHALPDGRPNVMVEVRQDLIATEAGQEQWAALIGPALRRALAVAGIVADAA